jgi:hypothetical protein
MQPEIYVINILTFRAWLCLQVPYMEDPNTGAKMFESADIVEYLRATYAVPQA